MGGVGDELPLLLPGFLDGAKGPAGEEDVDGEEDGQCAGSGQREGGREGFPSLDERGIGECHVRAVFHASLHVDESVIRQDVCSIGCLGNRLRRAFYGAFIDGDDGLLGECGGKASVLRKAVYGHGNGGGLFAPSQDHAACFFGCRLRVLPVKGVGRRCVDRVLLGGLRFLGAVLRARLCLGFCFPVRFGGFVNSPSEGGLHLLEILLALVETDADKHDDHHKEYGRHVERDEFDAESFEHGFLLEEAFRDRGRDRRVLFGEFVSYLTDCFYPRI